MTLSLEERFLDNLTITKKQIGIVPRLSLLLAPLIRTADTKVIIPAFAHIQFSRVYHFYMIAPEHLHEKMKECSSDLRRQT